MYSGETEFYKLPQYSGTDKPTFLGDFNSAMKTIDSVMHENATSASSGGDDISQAETDVKNIQVQVANLVTQTNNLETTAGNLQTQLTTLQGQASTAYQESQTATENAQTANTNATLATNTANNAITVNNANASALASLEERVSNLESPSVDAGTTYFKKGNNANFTEIISSLGKTVSDFTANNFRAVCVTASSSPTGTGNINTPSNGGFTGSFNISMTYNNGVVSAKTSDAASVQIPGSTRISLNLSVGLAGIIFDPSDNPFA